jgi:hypothetical protein
MEWECSIMAVTQIKDGFAGGSDNQLKVNSDGSINVTTGGGGGNTNVNLHDAGGNDLNSTGGSLDVNITGGTISATNPSVGTTGATAPTSATEMGAIDGSGNLQSLTVDPAGKLLVDITGTSTVTGTVNASIEGLTAFQTSQYTIGTSAVQLTPTPLTNRSSMSIKANLTSTNLLYIGNSNAVTSSTGYALFNGDSIQLDLTPAQAIWAISTAASQIAYVLEIGD